FSNANCEGPPLFGPDAVAVPSGSSGELKVNSAEFTTNRASTVKGKAVYSGDANNEKAETCGGAGETTTVNKAKTTNETAAEAAVTVGAKVKEEATLRGWVNTLVGGEVTFTAFSNAKCEGPPLFGPDEVEVPAGVTGEEKVHSAEFT